MNKEKLSDRLKGFIKAHKVRIATIALAATVATSSIGVVTHFHHHEDPENGTSITQDIGDGDTHTSDNDVVVVPGGGEHDYDDHTHEGSENNNEDEHSHEDDGHTHGDEDPEETGEKDHKGGDTDVKPGDDDYVPPTHHHTYGSPVTTYADITEHSHVKVITRESTCGHDDDVTRKFAFHDHSIGVQVTYQNINAFGHQEITTGTCECGHVQSIKGLVKPHELVNIVDQSGNVIGQECSSEGCTYKKLNPVHEHDFVGQTPIYKDIDGTSHEKRVEMVCACGEHGTPVVTREQHAYDASTAKVTYKSVNATQHQQMTTTSCVCGHEKTVAGPMMNHTLVNIVDKNGNVIGEECSSEGCTYKRMNPTHEHSFVEQTPTYKDIDGTNHQKTVERVCACGDKQTPIVTLERHAYDPSTAVTSLKYIDATKHQLITTTSCVCGHTNVLEGAFASHDMQPIMQNGVQVGVGCECGYKIMNPVHHHSYEDVITYNDVDEVSHQKVLTKTCSCGHKQTPQVTPESHKFDRNVTLTYENKGDAGHVTVTSSDCVCGHHNIVKGSEVIEHTLVNVYDAEGNLIGQECSAEGCTYTKSLVHEHTYADPETTYELKDDNQHVKVITRKSTCGHADLVTRTSEDHHITTTTTYESQGAAGHIRVDTDKCGDCTYSKEHRAETVTEHTMVDILDENGNVIGQECSAGCGYTIGHTHTYTDPETSYELKDEKQHVKVITRKSTCGHADIVTRTNENHHITTTTKYENQGEAGHIRVDTDACGDCTYTKEHRAEKATEHTLVDVLDAEGNKIGEECSAEGCTYTKSITHTHTYADPETTYELKDDNQHVKVVTRKSTCGHADLVTRTSEDHQITTTTTYESKGAAGHIRVDTDKCGSCTYSKEHKSETVTEHNMTKEIKDAEGNVIGYECADGCGYTIGHTHTYGAATTSYESVTETGHVKVVTEASTCGHNSRVTKTDETHTFVVKSTTYVDQGASGHVKVETMECACGKPKTVTSDPIIHDMSVEVFDETGNLIGHKCSAEGCNHYVAEHVHSYGDAELSWVINSDGTHSRVSVRTCTDPTCGHKEDPTVVEGPTAHSAERTLVESETNDSVHTYEWKCVCGESVKEKETSEHTFTYDESKPIYESATSKYYTGKCECGRTKTIIVDKEASHEHTYGDAELSWVINSDGTHSRVSVRTCTDPTCGHKEDPTVVEGPTAHSAERTLVESETNDSVHTYEWKCVCGESVREKETSEHTFTYDENAPIYESDSSKYYTGRCECGRTKTIIVEKEATVETPAAAPAMTALQVTIPAELTDDGVEQQIEIVVPEDKADETEDIVKGTLVDLIEGSTLGNEEPEEVIDVVDEVSQPEEQPPVVEEVKEEPPAVVEEPPKEDSEDVVNESNLGENNQEEPGNQKVLS